jgi:hypothetical protein
MHPAGSLTGLAADRLASKIEYHPPQQIEVSILGVVRCDVRSEKHSRNVLDAR